MRCELSELETTGGTEVLSSGTRTSRKHTTPGFFFQ